MFFMGQGSGQSHPMSPFMMNRPWSGGGSSVDGRASFPDTARPWQAPTQGHFGMIHSFGDMVSPRVHHNGVPPPPRPAANAPVDPKQQPLGVAPNAPTLQARIAQSDM